MISILDVANKLQALLDAAEDFSQYEFYVQTHGFHLDRIDNQKTGKNFIPVFVSSMGGTNNPVANLEQAEYTIPLTFYYPVRFKDDFFLLYDYLVTCFVGKFVTYGEEDARCNISIAQYGEIQDLDFKEFKNWVDSLYKRTIEVMEPYMSMQVTLYLSKSGDAFFYGDKIKITSVSITKDGNSIFTDTKPIVIERAVIGTSENAPQQALDETYISGYPANLGYTKELPLIIKDTVSYYNLLKALEVDKTMQNLVVTITEEIPFTTATLTISDSYYITNYSRRTAYGSLVGISLTLTNKRS